MKKEFMLYIRNAGDAKAALSTDEHSAFIRHCEFYIAQLQAADKLIAAQPIAREGCIISKNEHGWTKTAIDPAKEVQVGYYHVRANDLEEAIAMAKDNPEFKFVPSASIEVRPVKTKEMETGFTYPSANAGI